MYRTVFTPSEQNSNIPFVIPNEWYGQKIEFTISPVYDTENQQKEPDMIFEPDDDFYKSLSADEFRVELIDLVEKIDKKYTKKCK